MDARRIKIDRALLAATRLVDALRAAGLRPGRPVITSDGADDIGFNVSIGWRGTPGATHIRAARGRIELTGGTPWRVLASSDDWRELAGIVAAALEEQRAAKPAAPRAADSRGYDRDHAYHGD